MPMFCFPKPTFKLPKPTLQPKPSQIIHETYTETLSNLKQAAEQAAEAERLRLEEVGRSGVPRNAAAVR